MTFAFQVLRYVANLRNVGLKCDDCRVVTILLKRCPFSGDRPTLSFEHELAGRFVAAPRAARALTIEGDLTAAQSE